ncbi:benzoate 4-monooxygenase cytochrome P450 [Xylariaceae sp. FL0662B]|nr:benzoate 4-monooxygenase cytochrome P450 [Xylariaceae sp. FL0662B]
MDDFLKFSAFCALCLTLQLLFTRYRGGLADIPGPFSASFCNLWKVLAVYKDDMPQRNIAVHRKYGSVVRIGPNHVSFSSPEALQIIHGSRQAYPKSEFYKQTVAIFEGIPLLNLFSVRDVNYHSSLKKTIAGLYTKTAVLDLEPKIDACVKLFTDQMKKLTRESGPTDLDMSLWVHLFSFDCLGELNVSKKFGFLQSGKDINRMIEKSDRLLIMTGLYAQAPVLLFIQRIMEAIWGMRKTNPILIYTSSLVKERLKYPTPTPDMLNNFLKLHEAQPDKLSIREITGSLYINLMAGHDVLAVTLRAIMYYLARTPRVAEKLRAELATLEAKYPLPSAIPYAELTKLSYLDAVIQESLRIHGNLGLVNERVVPPEGATIDGYNIPGGTIVGINPWVIHRNTEIFGEDVDVFRPERWLDGSEDKISEMRRNLFSFGAGPRMCIGKNIAMMQICKFITEFYRHFDAELTHPEKNWHVVGNWVTKQTDMNMLVTHLKEKGDSKRSTLIL